MVAHWKTRLLQLQRLCCDTRYILDGISYKYVWSPYGWLATNSVFVNSRCHLLPLFELACIIPVLGRLHVCMKMINVVSLHCGISWQREAVFVRYE